MGILTTGKFTLGTKTKAQIASLLASTSLTGVGSITAGTAIVTGTGTLFTQQLIVGDVIKISSYSFVVLSITSDTSLTVGSNASITISGGTLSLLNPKRIKKGDSVYNITDRFPMYYSGDDGGFVSLPKWKSGNFVNGQVVAIRNASDTSGITEGRVLYTTTSASLQASVFDYAGSAIGVDGAVGVSYFTANSDAVVPTAVSGIHNTDVATGTPAKGSFLKPTTSATLNGIILDSTTTPSGDTCGVACTSTGTPVAGEIEMLVDFIERI